jgi:hypothetical protein
MASNYGRLSDKLKEADIERRMEEEEVSSGARTLSALKLSAITPRACGGGGEGEGGGGCTGGEEGGGGEGADGGGGEGGGREDSPHSHVAPRDRRAAPHARRCVRVRPERPFRHWPTPAGARPDPTVSRPPGSRHEGRVCAASLHFMSCMCTCALPGHCAAPHCADREARPWVPAGEGGPRAQEAADGDDPRRDQRRHHLGLYVQGRRAGTPNPSPQPSPPPSPPPPPPPRASSSSGSSPNARRTLRARAPAWCRTRSTRASARWPRRRRA